MLQFSLYIFFSYFSLYLQSTSRIFFHMLVIRILPFAITFINFLLSLLLFQILLQHNPRYIPYIYGYSILFPTVTIHFFYFIYNWSKSYLFFFFLFNLFKFWISFSFSLYYIILKFFNKQKITHTHTHLCVLYKIIRIAKYKYIKITIHLFEIKIHFSTIFFRKTYSVELY